MMNTYGSLFSGVGGFDMGFDQAGFTCAFQVEWDKHCQQVLNRHWPDVPKWSDVQDVNGAEVPPCDVLIFGSPCQDLSVAGKRAGIDGGRSSMFFEAIRIIKEIQNATGGIYPRVAVWENVPGALSSNKGEDFQTVLTEMANLGSNVTEWAVLDAQHFGVPQRRRRVFLVAIFDPTVARLCPDPLFPVREGRRGDYQKGIKKGETTTGTLTESIGSDCLSSDTDQMISTPVMLDFQGSKGNSITNEDDVSFTLNAHGHNAHVISTAVKTVRSGARDKDGNLPPEVWQETDLAPTLNSMDNTGESRATILAYESPIFFQMHQSGETRIQQNVMHTLAGYMGTGGNNTPMVSQPTVSFGRQETFYAGDTHDEITTALTTSKTPAVLAPTLTAANNPSRSPQSTEITKQVEAVFEASHAVRRLTPLECERLMGWPDDHTRWTADGKEQSDSARYKQCGNGVATPVARWVAEQIKGVL